MMKRILIPVAAFAITVTGASAFGGSEWIEELDLNFTDAQITALKEAEEIREAADKEAREVLEDAGIGEEELSQIHEAMHKSHAERHEALMTAIEEGDYDAFLELTEHSPFTTVDTEAEFESLQEAHELMESGDRTGAEEIFETLGLPQKDGGPGTPGDMKMRGW